MSEKTRDTAALLRKVECLERQIRSIKIFGFVAAAFAGLLILAGAAGNNAPDTIQAQRFEVVDKQGKVQGWFTALPTGGAVVSLNGGAGLLMATDDQGYLYLRDDRKAKARLAVEDGKPSLTLQHAGGKSVWSLDPSAE